MDQFGNEFRATRRFGITHGSEPVQHRGPVGIRVVVTLVVRVYPLAHDEIGNAIAIDIGDGGSVRFGECYSAGIRGRVVVCDYMFDERDRAVLVPFLLVPGDSPSVSFETGDDIVQAVAVDV